MGPYFPRHGEFTEYLPRKLKEWYVHLLFDYMLFLNASHKFYEAPVQINVRLTPQSVSECSLFRTCLFLINTFAYMSIVCILYIFIVPILDTVYCISLRKCCFLTAAHFILFDAISVN